MDNLPYQEVWISQVPILCIRGCQNSPLLSHLLLQPGGLCFGCILVLFWLSFGCILVLFWLCFGCVLVVFGLHHYCIQLCFLYLVETLLCIFPSPLRLFSPAHLLAFILIAFQLYLSVHTHIWWKHFFANSPCFVSAARPACPPPPLLTSTSSPQTWRASETRVEILTDFKSQMQPMDIKAKW